MRSIAIAGAIVLVACGGNGPTAPTVDAPASAPTESSVDVPVSGRVLDFATNSGVASATAGDDGWYRLDLRCPTDSILPGLVGFNTTFIYVGHPKYGNVSEVAGRGVAGVRRRF